MTVKIDLQAVRMGERHRNDLGDLESLKSSLEELGLLQPIGITPDHTLIFGERRLEAARMAGWETIEARVIKIASIVDGELAENDIRKDFTASERVAIAETVAAELRERERRGRPIDPEIRAIARVSQVPETADERETRSLAAKRAGFGSARNLNRAKAVVEAAEEDPEAFEDLVSQMDRTGKINGAHKELEKRRVAKILSAQPLPAPAGTFDVLVIDPPWPYQSRAKDASHRASNPYPDLSVDEICKLPIANHLNENAIVWLWTTNAFMGEAYMVADAWGLRVRTILTWAKDRMGAGDWLRGKTEHALLCTRGRPTVTLTNQTTLIHGLRREHSRKPDEFYALVESLCPGTKLDYFAREARAGWQTWGVESSKFA